MPSNTVIDALLARYLADNPGYGVPSGDRHPAILALSIPVKHWICDQLGIERYWRHMLSAAEVWFQEPYERRIFRYFCLRFEAEGNIFWQGRPEFVAISGRYTQWRAQMVPNNSFKPKPLRGSA
jgi:hypothetical protein